MVTGSFHINFLEGETERLACEKEFSTQNEKSPMSMRSFFPGEMFMISNFYRPANAHAGILFYKPA
jgi:hypothetical protein